MTAPSIDAVSGLVEELRLSIATASNDDYSKAGTRERERHVARLDAMSRAASALEAQARELAEVRRERDEARRSARNNREERLAQKARIAALEDALRVKDEALAWYADPISYALTQMNEPRSAVHGDNGHRARTALSNGEPHDR